MPTYIQTHTERWHRTLLAWLEEEWNLPNRTDYYLMQIVCAISRILSKKPGSIKIDQFKIKFERPKVSNAAGALSDVERRDKATAASKSRWLSAVGFRKRSDIQKAEQTERRQAPKRRQGGKPRPMSSNRRG